MAKPKDEFVIEKGVEVWGRGSGCLRNSKYPFEQMEIGDSFYSNKNPYSLAVRWVKKRKLDWWFSCRKDGRGYRLWRIK